MASAIIETIIEEAVEESVETAVEETVEETVETTVEESVEEAVEETVEEVSQTINSPLGSRGLQNASVRRIHRRKQRRIEWVCAAESITRFHAQKVNSPNLLKRCAWYNLSSQ